MGLRTVRTEGEYKVLSDATAVGFLCHLLILFCLSSSMPKQPTGQIYSPAYVGVCHTSTLRKMYIILATLSLIYKSECLPCIDAKLCRKLVIRGRVASGSEWLSS